jgi:hypothetical protein
MARMALAAERRGLTHGDDTPFLAGKRLTARFYAEHFLALAPGYLCGAIGGNTVLDFDPDRF